MGRQLFLLPRNKRSPDLAKHQKRAGLQRTAFLSLCLWSPAMTTATLLVSYLLLVSARAVNEAMETAEQGLWRASCRDEEYARSPPMTRRMRKRRTHSAREV